MSDGVRIPGLTLDVTIDPGPAKAGGAIAREELDRTGVKAEEVGRKIDAASAKSGSMLQSFSASGSSSLSKITETTGLASEAGLAATAAFFSLGGALSAAAAAGTLLLKWNTAAFEQLRELDKQALQIERSAAFSGAKIGNAAAYWELYRKQLEVTTGFVSTEMLPVLTDMIRITGKLESAEYATHLTARLGQLTGNLHQAETLIAALYAGKSEIEEEGLTRLGIQKKITDQWLAAHKEIVEQAGLHVGSMKTNVMLLSEVLAKVQTVEKIGRDDEYGLAVRRLKVAWEEVIAAMRPLAEIFKQMVIDWAPKIAETLIGVAETVDRIATGLRLAYEASQALRGNASDFAGALRGYTDRSINRQLLMDSMASGLSGLGEMPAPNQQAPAASSAKTLAELLAKNMEHVPVPIHIKPDFVGINRRRHETLEEFLDWSMGRFGVLGGESPVDLGGGGVRFSLFGAAGEAGLDTLRQMSLQFEAGQLDATSYQVGINGITEAFALMNVKGSALSDMYAKQVNAMAAVARGSASLAQAKRFEASLHDQLSNAVIQQGQAYVYAWLMGQKVQADMLKSTVANIAAEAAVRALFELAAAWASFATYQFDAGDKHLASAAIYGTVAAYAIPAALLLPGGGSSGGAAAGNSAFADTTSAPRGLAAAATPAPVINVYVEGHVLTADELARILADATKRQSGRAGV